MFAFLAAVAIVAQAAPLSSPAPAQGITTSVLAYNVPSEGYKMRQETEAAGGVKWTATSLIDRYGNRDVDLAISLKTTTARSEYLLMDGLLYSKTGTAWVLDTVAQPVINRILSMQNYLLPSTFQAPGRSVREQGHAPCGSDTCNAFIASAIVKSNEQPMVYTWNLLVDPATHFLYGADISATKADNTPFIKMHVTYDDIDKVRLPVPEVTAPALATPQCQPEESTQGKIEICVFKGLSTEDVYTLRVAGTLALRASEDAVLNGVASPVIDGEMLRCTPKSKDLTVDPNLAATLRRSGMSDAQIQTTLGRKEIATDCVVTDTGTPVTTAHFDFK